MEWKEFFYFNKSDRKVLLLLAVFSIVFLLLSLFTSESEDLGKAADSTAVAVGGDSLTGRQRKYGNPNTPYYASGSYKPERFPFDPNTADSNQLLRLGLQSWQVRNIYKYRAAGGVYTKPSDFARLYGLTAKQYRELEPYITISSDYRPASELVAKETPMERDTVRYPVKISPTEHVALNTADTMMLRKVPGIGSYYARRIVSYRERLGGFVDVEQLREIEGFPEDAMKYFLITDGNIRRLNLNKLTLAQLKAHPYINFYQARDIVEYRRLKGPLHSLDDLRLLANFPPEVIRKLEPYVEF